MILVYHEDGWVTCYGQLDTFQLNLRERNPFFTTSSKVHKKYIKKSTSKVHQKYIKAFRLSHVLSDGMQRANKKQSMSKY